MWLSNKRDFIMSFQAPYVAVQIREKKQVMSLKLSCFFNINSKKLLRMRNKCSKWDLGNCIMSGFFIVKTHFSLDFLQQKILFTNSGENPMWFYFGSSKNFACQNMYITHTLLTSYLIPFGRVNNYLSDEGSINVSLLSTAILLSGSSSIDQGFSVSRNMRPQEPETGRKPASTCSNNL